LERKVMEASIARTNTEKTVERLTAAREALDGKTRELEQGRASLMDRSSNLAEMLKARETSLAHAEEKIKSLADRMASRPTPWRIGAKPSGASMSSVRASSASASSSPLPVGGADETRLVQLMVSRHRKFQHVDVVAFDHVLKYGTVVDESRRQRFEVLHPGMIGPYHVDLALVLERQSQRQSDAAHRGELPIKRAETFGIARYVVEQDRRRAAAALFREHVRDGSRRVVSSPPASIQRAASHFLTAAAGPVQVRKCWAVEVSLSPFKKIGRAKRLDELPQAASRQRFTDG
jgi:hypothetical protein